MNLGSTEVIMIVVIALLLFGPSKLPTLGKSFGQAIRGFKQGMENPDEIERKVERQEEPTKTEV